LQIEALSLLRCKPEKYFGFARDDRIAISLMKGKFKTFHNGMYYSQIFYGSTFDYWICLCH